MAGEDKTLQISITAGGVFRALLVILAFFLLYQLLDLVLVILLAIVIAAAIEPATRWFGRYHVPRVLAVLFVYIVTFILFAVLVPVFVFPLLRDFSDLAATLPSKISSIPLLAEAPAQLTAWLGQVSFSDVFTGLGQNVLALPSGLIATTSFFFSTLFRLILVIVISFYLAVQRGGIESFLRLVTPLPQEKYVLDLWRRSQQKIGMWMQGQLLLGLIMGVLVFLGLTIFQVDHAILLACLAALFELIPFFGPILAAVPAVLVGFSTSTTLGFLVVGLYIIMQQFENHLIYPLVVRKIIGIPPLLVIISLIVGAELAGFMGLLLAVPLATVLVELLSDFEKNKYLFRKADA